MQSGNFVNDGLAARLYVDKHNLAKSLSSNEMGSSLSGRLRPKTLMKSESVPALRSSNPVSKTFSVDKAMDKNNSTSRNLLVNSSSGFFSQKKPSSATMNMSTSLDEEMKEADYIDAEMAASAPLSKVVYATFLESLRLSPKQLSDLLSVPRTFFYLRMQGKDSSAYELETVSQDEIDKDNYSTISKEGITQYRNKQSQFTPLTQFEREYKLFHRISSIRFFKLYKRWKSFFTWKKGIRRDKITSARESILSSLFLFNPSLRNALLAVRKISAGLSSTGMLNLKNGEIFRLEEFMIVQKEVHESLRASLESLSNEVLVIVRVACDEVVDEFLKSNNIVANHKMTFMERAALRAECRRLTKYLRLIDIMLSDFLRTMVQEMMILLVNCVESTHADLEPKVECADVDLKFMSKKRSDNCWKAPLFRIVVSFNTNSDATVDDSISIIPTQDQLNRAIDDIIRSAVDVVGALSTVFDSQDMEMYVMPDGDVEEEEQVEPMDISSMVKSSPIFIHSREMIMKQIKHTYKSIKHYVTVFDPYRQVMVPADSLQPMHVSQLRTPYAQACAYFLHFCSKNYHFVRQFFNTPFISCSFSSRIRNIPQTYQPSSRMVQSMASQRL